MISERDLIRSAERLRQALQEPSMNWITRDDPERAILQHARVAEPAAAAYFGAPTILACALTESALTADLSPDGHPCRWCHAFQRAGKTGEWPPVTEATVKFLGQPCSRCSKLTLRLILATLDEEMADDPEPEPVAAAAATPAPTVRDLINLARQRQRDRDAHNMALLAAAAADGDPTAKAKLARHHHHHHRHAEKAVTEDAG